MTEDGDLIATLIVVLGAALQMRISLILVANEDYVSILNASLCSTVDANFNNSS